MIKKILHDPLSLIVVVILLLTGFLSASKNGWFSAFKRNISQTKPATQNVQDFRSRNNVKNNSFEPQAVSPSSSASALTPSPASGQAVNAPVIPSISFLPKRIISKKPGNFLVGPKTNSEVDTDSVYDAFLNAELYCSESFVITLSSQFSNSYLT